MSQRTIVELIDDLDGSPGDQSVTFSIDGVNYEVDLNTENAKTLRDGLAPFISVGRRLTGNSQARRATRAAPTTTVNLEEVRKWARDNGYTVAERGRISRLVMDAYASGTPASANADPDVSSHGEAATEAPEPAAEATPRRRGSRKQTAAVA